MADGSSVIDAFVVQVGLDAGPYAKGARDATQAFDKTRKEAENAGRHMEEAGKKGAEFFAELRKSALELFAVLLGGRELSEFAKETVSGLAALGRQAQVLGTNVKDLDAFAKMMARNGETTEAARGTFQKFTEEINRWKLTGDTPLRVFFQVVGADKTDDALSVWRKFVAFAEQNKNNPGYVAHIGRGLGLSTAEISQAMKGAEENAHEFASAMKSAVDPEDVKKMEVLETAWIRLGQVIEHAAQSQMAFVLGPFGEWIKELDEFLEHETGYTKAFTALGIALTGVGIAWGGLRFMGALKGLSSLSGLASGVGGAGLTGAAAALTGAAEALTAAAAKLALAGGAPRVPGLNMPPGAAPAAAAGGGAAASTFWSKLGLWGGRLLRFGGAAGGAYLGATAGTNPIGTDEQEREIMGPGADLRPPPGGDAQGAIGLSDYQYQTYRSSVARIEGARYDQMGGAGGQYAGRYQMSQDVIAQSAGMYGEKVPSRREYLGNPAMQERYFSANTLFNHRFLMMKSARYRAMRPSEQLAVLAYAHNQGPGGALRFVETGQVGRDANGTPGTAYSDLVRQRLAAGRTIEHALSNKPATTETPDAPANGNTPTPIAQPDPSLVSGTRPAARQAAAAGPVSNDNSSETHIGQISVHTQATDADRIAADLGPAIRRRGIVSQANSGLN